MCKRNGCVLKAEARSLHCLMYDFPFLNPLYFLCSPSSSPLLSLPIFLTSYNRLHVWGVGSYRIFHCCTSRRRRLDCSECRRTDILKYVTSSCFHSLISLFIIPPLSSFSLLLLLLLSSAYRSYSHLQYHQVSRVFVEWWPVLVSPSIL